MKHISIVNTIDTHPRRSLLFVALTILGVHGSYLANGFTWLDHNDIENMRALLPIGHVFRAFMTRFGETGFYRPIVTIMHSIDYALYGLWSPGYHITNVVLHLLVAVISGYFIQAFVPLKTWQRLGIMLIVGIHPVSWIIAGGITYRQESLMILFSMCSLLAYTRVRTTNRLIYYVMTVIATLLALGSKETAFVFIPVFIVVWELNRESKRQNFLSILCAEIAIFTLYGIARMHAVPDVWKTKVIPLPISFAIGTRMWLADRFMLSLISPFPPTLSDAVPLISAMSLWTLGVVIPLVIALTYVIKNGIRSHQARLLILFVTFLIPALNIVPVPRIGSPHYAYPAVMVVASTVILILTRASRTKHLARIGYSVFALWIVIASYMSFNIGFTLHDDHTLFTPQVQNDHAFAEGYHVLGTYALTQGDYHTAGQNYEQALAPKPSYLFYLDRVSSLINLADVRLLEQRYKEADTLYIKALREAPKTLTPYITYNRALIAFNQGNYEQSVTILSTNDFLLQKPKAVFLLADSLQHLKRTPEARALLQSILPRLSPSEKVQVNQLMRSPDWN